MAGSSRECRPRFSLMCFRAAGHWAYFFLLLSPSWANQAILVAWYAIVPFHYFVDGRIWRRTAPVVAVAA